MLSRICQMLRRGIQNVDDLYTHSYLDTRGLRSYPKSITRKDRQTKAQAKKNKYCSNGVCITTEGDCV